MKHSANIIGGGLAGLALALDLRRRGFDVTVIEKGKYPRHKVCGEYLSLESERYVKSLCPSIDAHELPRIGHFSLSSRHARFRTPLPLGGLGISRYLLEDLLYRQALQEGVRVITGTRARDIHYSKCFFIVKTDKEVFCSHLLFDASGRKSNIRSGANVEGQRYIGVKYHVRMNREPSLIELHNFSGGYAGISNVEKGLSCFCYMVNASKLKQMSNSIPALEAKVLSANPALKKIFEDAEFVNREPLTISGIQFERKQAVRENVLCLGDAAGCVAPLTGNGMSMGLRSAHLLGELSERYVSGRISRQQLNALYEASWKSHFSFRIGLGRYLQMLAEYPLLASASIGLFRLVPPLAGGLIGLTHGKSFG